MVDTLRVQIPAPDTRWLIFTLVFFFFFLKKWANPGLFFVYFRLFKQTLQILQQI